MSVEPSVPDVTNASLEDRLYTVKYEDPGDSHLDVSDPQRCIQACLSDDCVSVCPANVWRSTEEGVPVIAYENCLECGSCRWACPYDNVEWEYPDTGAGVTYKRG